MIHLFKAITVCGLLLFFAQSVTAQSSPTPDWIKRGGTTSATFNGNSVIDMTTDKHGNIYVLSDNRGKLNIDGTIASTDGSAKFSLTSWDCNGNMRWLKIIGGGTSMSGKNIVADTSEGIFITGQFLNANASDSTYWDSDTALKGVANGLYIVKYNSSGVMQWFKTPQIAMSPTPSSCRTFQLSIGENQKLYWFAFLTQGSYDGGSYSMNTSKMVSVEYDSAGIFQTITSFDVSVSQTGFSAVGINFYPDIRDHGYYITGSYNVSMGILKIGNTVITTIDSTSIYPIFVAAFSKTGTNQWVKQSSAGKSSFNCKTAVDQDDNLYLLTGGENGYVFNSDTLFNTHSSNTYKNLLLMAMDTNGNKLWSKHGDCNSSFFIDDLLYKNNSVWTLLDYQDKIWWGNDSLLGLPSNYYSGVSLTRFHAGNGNLQSYDSLVPSFYGTGHCLTADKNNTIYVSGAFKGALSFNGVTVNSLNAFQDWFVAKYKNVNCNCNLLQPAFSYTQQAATTYQFTYNGTTPYTAIQWDFGDGAVTTANPSPTHTFAATKNYPVCVTVTNGCGENTACHWVNILPTDVQNLPTAGNILIYPNPTSNEIIFEKTTKGSCAVLYNLQGQRMQQTILNGDKNRMNISPLPQGVYLLRITAPNGTQISKRILKE